MREGRATRRVLAVGMGTVFARTVGPFMRRTNLALDCVEDLAGARQQLARHRFDVVVALADGSSAVLSLLDDIRSPRSDSRSAAVILVAEPDRLDKTKALLGRGANRVFCSDQPYEVLVLTLARLLAVARRIEVRVPVTLVVDLGEAHHIEARTENISASGMMVLTEAPIEIGERHPYRMRIDETNVVYGIAKVMREIRPREGKKGYGLRFDRFDAEGRRLLRRFLARFETG